MLEIGRIQTLEVANAAAPGIYLKEIGSSGKEKVLLPKNQVVRDFEPGDTLEVFLYKDSEDRPIATTAVPKLTLGQVGLLQVKDITDIGAFLDWGLAKDLLLPFREQTKTVKAGDTVLAALYMDKSSRLCATMKVYDYLKKDSPYKKDDMVYGTIYEISEEFGAYVAVDNKFSALLPKKEIFSPLRPGDFVEARITSVKPDGKLDLSLRQKAFQQLDEDSLLIYRRLLASQGILPFHDKSNPEDIKKEFNLSKNAFKRAIGHLLKDGKIIIKEDGIEVRRKQ